MAAQNGPTISWSNVVSTAAFLTLLVAGGWTIFQTQFNSVSSQVYENRQLIEKSIALTQAQLDRRIGELEKSDSNIKEKQLTQQEFKQFSENILGQLDRIRAQLAILEQTRPTIGELQVSSRNAFDSASKLEDRVRALEKSFQQGAKP